MLITGGSGFIGSAYIEKYGGENLDITSSDLYGDIRSPHAVDETVKGQDGIINMAAISGVMDCYNDPVNAVATNVQGAVNVLEAGRAHSIPVILASSGAVNSPTNPYAASKFAMETFAVAFAHSYGLDVSCLRFTNVYGPGSKDKTSAIAAFCKQALTTGKIIVKGTGEQTRDFVYIEDVVEAIKVVTDTPQQMKPPIINICGGNQPSISEIAHIIRDLAGDCEIVYTEPRIGDVPSNVVGRDFHRLQGNTDIRDGIEKTFNYFKEVL